MRLHPNDPAIAEHTSRPEALSRRWSWRRRAAWIGGLALLLALLILTPPLVNANRYRLRIAQTMSESLGRPVHLDSVTMHLLPVPGFTLQNLVVSEDPAFGAEPVIRANSVEATLRVSSLWHRPVEFSTVRFIDPSVNLVRNADGRWNLSGIVLHAAHVQTAPTGQRKAGPRPRFPYIEATGGRVNIKSGPEKLPFSLTNADFALWLPSANQWRVRLAGQPARTDNNITESGTVRLEGELHRAADTADVPINFRATWHDAPLGDATRILFGADQGWRGALNLDATLDGKLGNARLSSKLTLGGLRRAAFFPAHPLDLQITCSAGFAVQPAALNDALCTLPVNAPAPIQLHAEIVPLQNPAATALTVAGEGIPVRWALMWAALFSARVPTDLHPKGTLAVHMAHLEAALPEPTAAPHTGRSSPRPLPATAAWTGQITATLPVPVTPSPAGSPTGSPADAPETNVLVWSLGAPAAGHSWPSLHLPPTPVTLGPGSLVNLSGSLSAVGSTESVSGNASASALLLPARYLPQLADGLDKVLPYPVTGATPVRVQFSCTHPWGGPATCSGHEPTGHRASGNAAPVLPATAPAHTAPVARGNLIPLSTSPLRPLTPANPR